MCVEQRLGVEITEECLLRTQHHVLDLLIVREIRRDQRLPRLLHHRRPPPEVEQKIGERQRRAVGRAVEDVQAALRGLMRSVVREAEIKLGIVRGATAAEIGLSRASLKPGGARGRIVGQRDVDRPRQRQRAGDIRLIFRECGGNRSGGRIPWRRGRLCRPGIVPARARGEKHPRH